MVRRKNRSGSGDHHSHTAPNPGGGGPAGGGQTRTAPDQPSSFSSAQRAPPSVPAVTEKVIAASGTCTAGSSGVPAGGGQTRAAPDQPSSLSSAQRAPPSVPADSQKMIAASGTSAAGSSGESSSSHAASSSAAAVAGQMTKLTLLPADPSPAAPPSSSKALKVPRRPGLGTSGQKCFVRANHFLVEVADKSYFHYDVSITPEVTSKGVNRHIITELVRLYKLSHLGNRMPAYDGKKSLYTAGALPFDSKEFKIILADKNDTNGSSSKSKGREREFKVTIRYAAKGDLNHLQRFLEGRQLDCPHEIIQMLDVVLRTIPSAEYNVVGRSFFATEFGQGDLGDGLVYWKGYYQSLRATQQGLSLNIDLSATAFYDSIDVIDFISKSLNFRHFSRPLQDHDRVKLKRALKAKRVKATHVPNSRSYKITGLSSQPVNKAMFSLDEQQTQISVFEYFKQKYNIVLKYPALPALQAGTDARPIYLPMELCQIVSGQKYNKKLNEKQVTNLLRASCQRPIDREKNIKAVVQKAFVDKHDDRDSLVKTEFGISVRTDPVVIEARVLPAPMLLYNRSGREPTVDPRVGQWNMINKKLFDGGRVDAWACVCFSNKVHRDFPPEFCAQLVDMCTSKGMVFNKQPVIPIRQCDPYHIEKALVDVHKETLAALARYPNAPKQIQLLLIILPDMSGSYGKIKRVCETELGIVSQCCQPSKASRLSKQYLENVALKINVKVGGRNTVLNDAILRKIPRVSDVPTIIFGADVTHPQPGDDTTPSIAAVVASMDWPEICKYRGLVSAQGHRDEIIQDLYKVVPDQKGSVTHKGMIRELLISFRRSTNRKPERIIFFRDGVSDGQFSHVLLYEMDAIRKACASLEEGYLPPVTFIVVQKRHHTRFFPEHGSRMTDKSGNVMPGTVVDTRICHPSEFDFYLNSHAGIQGTSRPAHYHVLFDENSFSANNLQMLTNALCFTFARCTRSVSVVPPAYYAHLAAFRARYYIEGDEASDAQSSASGAGGRLARGAAAQVEVRPLPAIKDSVKDVMFYC